MRRMFATIGCALRFFLPDSVLAASLERADIAVEEGAYHYIFVATLSANLQAVRGVVLDVANFSRVNHEIRRSRLLQRMDDSSFKRQIMLRHCLLVFCFNLDFVEHVILTPHGDITATILPAESSFRQGTARWHFQALDAHHTRISLQADQTPDFWIPPVIGPVLIKHSFVTEVDETVNNIERFANEKFQ